MNSRTTYARQIETLDPETDHHRIVYLLTCYEFPWDIERALEFALFRTHAVFPDCCRSSVAAALSRYEWRWQSYPNGTSR